MMERVIRFSSWKRGFALPVLSLIFLYQIHAISSAENGEEPIFPFDFHIHENTIPIVADGNHFRTFLEPCDIRTIQTPCTDEEYENNEDCLPQKSDNCDHSKELYCLSGVCLPNCHPHKEIYDHLEGKCFRKVGSDCRPQNFSDAFPECEKNAVCERGQCRCGKGFSYDHNFNKCVTYAGYHKFCNETLNCDVKSDIICKESQCQCKALSQYYHLKRKRCYVQIGQVCSTGLQFCPDNSICLRLLTNHKLNNSLDEKLPNSQLKKIYQDIIDEGKLDDDEEPFIGILDDESDFICKCDKGYGSTMDKRFCMALHGAKCNTLHRCNSERGLKCYEGECICDRARVKEHVYSEIFQHCITVPGASCNSEEDICPIGASCKNGQCTCDDGLKSLNLSTIDKESVAHSCMKMHGITCQEDDIFEPQCNYEAGLECKEGKCLCQSSDKYFDTNLGKCKSSQGNDKIPVIHFTPPDDREYRFHLNRRNGSESARFSFINSFLNLIIIFIANIL